MLTSFRNWAGQSSGVFRSSIAPASNGRECFSLGRSLGSYRVFFKLGITSLNGRVSSRNDEGDPVGSPSNRLLCGKKN